MSYPRNFTKKFRTPKKFTEVCSFFLAQPDYECEFINGDGHGRSEYKIGQQTGSECIRACINWMKVGQLGVNGVTVLRDNNPGAKFF